MTKVRVHFTSAEHRALANMYNASPEYTSFGNFLATRFGRRIEDKGWGPPPRVRHPVWADMEIASGDNLRLHNLVRRHRPMRPWQVARRLIVFGLPRKVSMYRAVLSKDRKLRCPFERGDCVRCGSETVVVLQNPQAVRGSRVRVRRGDGSSQLVELSELLRGRP